MEEERFGAKKKGKEEKNNQHNSPALDLVCVDVHIYVVDSLGQRQCRVGTQECFCQA